MILYNADFTIRTWEDDDAESLSRHADNKAIFDMVRNRFPTPYTLEEAQKWISFAKAHSDPPCLFAIVVNGEACGSIGLELQHDIHRLNAEMGFFIGEAFWGRGVMTKAVKEVVEYAFDRLKLNRVYAETFENNIASMRVLEKAGLKKEAILKQNVIKNDKILDSHLYAILASEWFS